MVLVVDLTAASVTLADPRDLQRFSVRVLPSGPGDSRESGALGALAAALSVHHTGRVEPGGDALILPDAVRRLARTDGPDGSPGVDATWEAGFGDMLAYAGTKGWIAEDGAIRAHVEWERS